MGVRNCAEIGENLHRIINRLLANNDLVNLLYYTDKDPLNQPALTQKQKQEEIFEKLIKIVPRIGPKEDSKSIVVVKATRASKDPSNTEFRNVKVQVEIFVPLTQWFIKDTNLRPYLIMGEIEKSLNGKTVNGLGKMSGGDFDTNFFTEEISAFEQVFWITSYE